MANLRHLDKLLYDEIYRSRNSPVRCALGIPTLADYNKEVLEKLTSGTAYTALEAVEALSDPDKVRGIVSVISHRSRKGRVHAP